MTKVKTMAALAGTMAALAFASPSQAAAPMIGPAVMQPGARPVVTEVQYWHRPHYYHHYYRPYYHRGGYYHHYHHGVRIGPVVIR